MRRQRSKMNRERFCGNVDTYEVHDLDNEKEDCNIDQILDKRLDRPFFSLQQANNARFTNRHECVTVSDERSDAAYLPEDER